MDLLKIIEFVKPFYEKKDIMHNLSHIDRVLKYVDKLINIRLDVTNKEIVTYAAYFHGFIYSHENTIRGWLKSQNISEDCISKIVKVAWESQKNEEAETLEGKILHDAHMIEGGRTYLIVKSLITGSVRGQTLEQTIYYIEKNILDKGLCYLKEAQEIYDEQQAFAKDFIESLKEGLDIDNKRINNKINKIEKLIANFKARNIEVNYFETIQDAENEILTLVPTEVTVGIGHSATLQKMDITKTLKDRGNTVFDKDLAKDKEECKVLKKKALLAEWYITGSNAISVDGRIVNVDHSGNRVAAITFGPDNVIIIVGVNKIVDTWEDAIKRVKNIACPLNAKRAGFNPPCVKLNKCMDCTSIERVCNSLSIIEGQSVKGRIKVFIVNEDLGF